MDLSGKKIGFLGDSITEGVGASSPQTCFVSVFAGAHPECRVFNYGIGGTRIAYVQNTPSPQYNDRNPFGSRLKIMEEGLDVVFVFGGTNDYGHGNAPFGSGEDETKDTFCGSLCCLGRELIEKYPDARIVFVTPMRRQGENEPRQRPDGMFTLYDHVKAIRAAAERFSFPVLDLWATLGIVPDIAAQRERFAPDGLHPNDAGHRRIAAAVDAFLRRMF